jgi:hypothetical protein
MADLANRRRCWWRLSGSTLSIAGIAEGAENCSKSRAPHTDAPQRVLKKSTGTTALPWTACFLHRSYRPRKKAERRLAKIQFMRNGEL